ncbi:MAG TPA: trehalose-phosphatase [Opitutales bacterium]|nr:trehalose-phosphatase [Opitutales bacterium]
MSTAAQISEPTIHLSRQQFDAVIFDLDGVVTQTASVHAASWKKLFDDFLKQKAKESGEIFIPFDEDRDYLTWVDGKPRHDGIQSFLQSRNISIPLGDPADPPDKPTIYGLGKRKNDFFLAAIEEEGIKVYDSTVSLIRKLRENGFRTAIISSSKNCKKILETAGISDLFETRVDGLESERLGIKGKPAPDIFLEAAKRLNVSPARTVVFEDALSGVQAGHAGKFGCVIGVNRGDQKEELKDNGADIVVDDLAAVGIAKRTSESSSRLEDLPDASDCLSFVTRTPGSRIIVFLDYDGTLSPIVEDPKKAVIDKETRRAIARLAKHCTVAIISGRDLADVRKRVGLPNLAYAGSHGFDISAPGGLRKKADEVERFLPLLDDAEKELREKAASIEGSYIERKKFSIAIHSRRVPEPERPRIEKIVEEVHSNYPDLRKTSGKMVFELQPSVDWDKGKAVLWLLKVLQIDADTSLPIYIGDDITDEDAFRVLPSHGVGIVVKGGTHQTLAQYALADTEAVKNFLARLTAELSMGASIDSWALTYEGFDPEKEKLHEALCTLGNGVFATRGAAPESSADEVHAPGTYLAGGYNRLKTEIAGRIVENEDLVNLPNWLPLSFRIEGGEWFDLRKVTLLDVRQTLNLRNGTLEREVEFRDPEGRESVLTQRRLVHMKYPHLAALETTVDAVNWSGKIEFRSGLDGQVRNTGVDRYQDLNNQHLKPSEEREVSEELIALKVETVQSEIRIAQAARTRIFRLDGDEPISVERRTLQEPGKIEQLFTIEISPDNPVTVEKIVALVTSRDRAISEAGIEAIKWVTRAGSFSDLFDSHALTWKQLWRRFNIDLALTDPFAGLRTNLILRLHSFHLLQTTSIHTMELDTGVPARGWHGEAYRGHIFWDELFIFPFLNLRIPEITRKLLSYRYRRLNEARFAAKEAGYKGAMFPWQSGSDGREETQVLHLNPKSGRWIPDNSHLQRHVNAAIAYNAWKYYEATGHQEFFAFHSAEMILEIARFWTSLAKWNEKTERYDITGVMGPDEYHDALPDAEEPGLPNNAYTNVMASWVLTRALDTLKMLATDRREELCETLELREDEIDLWDKISRKLTVPFHGDGIISQFEGYEDLEELDWEKYHKVHGEVLRLDRILEAEGDSSNRYKASKQADVLMLFYLFSSDELRTIFDRLGYPIDDDLIRRNIAYYSARTAHGSTLSHIVHSWVAARFDRKRSWEFFRKALESDVADVQGGTTPEGIHLGAMAGTVDLVQRCFTGIETCGDALHINPVLPDEIDELTLQFRYRGHSLILEIVKHDLYIRSLHSSEGPIRIMHDGRAYELKVDTTLSIPLKQTAKAA